MWKTTWGIILSVFVALVGIYLYRIRLVEEEHDRAIQACRLGPTGLIPTRTDPSFKYNPSVGDHIKGECFFETNYTEARNKFRELAIQVGAETLSFPIFEQLTTDVAIVQGIPSVVLLHISGTHGPEAFAGSAIQLTALSLLLEEKSRLGETYSATMPTIVFVHALNPYGFHTLRRVNENNIDLNRNFLSPADFAFVVARDPDFAGYPATTPAVPPSDAFTHTQPSAQTPTL